MTKEEKLVRLVVERIGDVRCSKTREARERESWRGRVWRWFVAGEEVSKTELKERIWKALPFEQRTDWYVRLVMANIKVTREKY